MRIYDKILNSRLLLGTARYPSLSVLQSAIAASGAEIITVSLRRQAHHAPQQPNTFWQTLQATGCHILPNTAGCHSVREALTTAEMAREVFQTPWIKLEIIADDYSLQPDPFALVDASRQLLAAGFQVLPYCTDDLVLCQKLVDLGCQVIMPWAAPIGSNQGLLNPYALRTLRSRLPQEITLIVDAGIGAPAHAAAAMELGFDGVLLNSAVALATDPVNMARAFGLAVQAGHLAHQAGLPPKKDFATPSTPLLGRPFWQQTATAAQSIVAEPDSAS